MQLIKRQREAQSSQLPKVEPLLGLVAEGELDIESVGEEAVAQALERAYRQATSVSDS